MLSESLLYKHRKNSWTNRRILHNMLQKHIEKKNHGSPNLIWPCTLAQNNSGGPLHYTIGCKKKIPIPDSLIQRAGPPQLAIVVRFPGAPLVAARSLKSSAADDSSPIY
jgi:hypothetical protein